METFVDPNECLQDSPQFRIVLEKREAEIDVFEKTISDVLKQCSLMIEVNKQFIRAKHNFLSSLVNLCSCFSEKPDISKCIRRFIEPLYEINKYETVLNEQHNKTFSDNLANFLQLDIGTIKELKRRFEKRSDDLDLVYTRYSQVPKSKHAEWKEASNMLTATRSCFQHLTLDYVAQLALFMSRRQHVVLDSLLSLVTSYNTFFHQGYDALKDLKDFNTETANQLVDMRIENGKLEKSLSNRHHLVQQCESLVPIIIRNDESIRLEGYLFKRTSSTFKSWNRRWFVIQNHQLVYQKRSNERELVVMEDDLRLCNARPLNDIDRRFCFEVVSPTKSHILQAESEESCKQWLSALQAGIDAAYNSKREPSVSINHNRNSSSYLESSSVDSLCTNTSSTSNNSNTLQTNVSNTLQPSIYTGSVNNSLSKLDYQKIFLIPGNEKCADCECADPVWASINLGITLCIECSGVHRSLGVHVSKVRSLTLDHLDCEQINVILELGNNMINEIYLAKWPLGFNYDNPIKNDSLNYSDKSDSSKNTEVFIDSDHGEDVNKSLLSSSNKNQEKNFANEWIEKIHSNSPRNKREKWIRAKYVEKLFVDKSVNLLIKNDDKHDDLENISRNDFEIETFYSKNTHNSFIQYFHDKILAKNFSIDPLRNKIIGADPTEYYFNLLLYEASARCDLKTMTYALASDATINWCNPDDLNRTALFQAVNSGTMTACEYLLLNGAKCNIQDDDGSTALHYAARSSNTGQVCLLLKRGADSSIQNSSQEDPLVIALNNASADIVTVLRLKKLKDEMRHDELGTQSDETFNEVVRDLSRVQIISESSSSNVKQDNT